MTDLLLQTWTALAIEAARLGHARDRAEPWMPGRPLRLLFAGYNGARNTGSDVRVEEMLRQVHRVLGADRVVASVLTQDPRLTRGYFAGARQVRLPDVFPPFLAREVPRHDGVIACEGSMFKSRFADALTTMMVGALGIAAARNRLSVGYGAEAGEMSASLRRLVRRYCGTSLVITRNEESARILRELRVPTEPGADTAWTFRPHPSEHGRRLLAAAGWDGTTDVLAVCPIHPFWWPVKAEPAKWAALAATGAFRESHYRSLYFHRSGAKVTDAFRRYVDAVSGAVDAFRRERRVFPVLVAMERLDEGACRRIAAKLGGAPVFSSAGHDMYEIVSILRESRMLLSSRFHALVTTMPALVPAVGVTMDERIRNLMKDCGREDLSIEADEPDLEARLLDALRRIRAEEDALRPALGGAVVRNLKRMAQMGLFLEEEVARRFPGFETRRGLVRWEQYLPELSPDLLSLVERHGDAAAPPEPVRVAEPAR
ncbi:MAG: polysaccharide pyruvyl transferase family protein [Candidatus Eiseniibacteriota bacterium]